MEAQQRGMQDGLTRAKVTESARRQKSAPSLPLKQNVWRCVIRTRGFNDLIADADGNKK